MRIGKRNFRHRLRKGFYPYFNKRGDRIRDPFSSIIANRSTGIPVWKYNKLSKSFKSEYYKRFSDMRYRNVKRTELGRGAYVSTVCLMLNHAHGDPAIPVLFESMLFNALDPRDESDCYRYYSLAEARKGHYEMVKMYRKKYRKTYHVVQQNPEDLYFSEDGEGKDETE